MKEDDYGERGRWGGMRRPFVRAVGRLGAIEGRDGRAMGRVDNKTIGDGIRVSACPNMVSRRLLALLITSGAISLARPAC